ncbi:LysR family transcriptional regulator [Photobacterium sanctipauli]|uniref:LysR family transcriptional regulator n=1 Tax=Photobacterium sanctipauli TaxID=1342794 RepID=A0A2T3NNH0_9GAMM|nr:LysR family transcriptional regulator [Photobacterium sanctipauli]PSW17265.1 LysR family transcriptional regulator [Photobacterium sanctipauli]
MKVTIEQLNTFIIVFEEHAFSAAAARLNKHRTSVAQIVGFLEDTLELKLFERDGRKLIPTEQATHLYYYAKQTVEQARSFEHVARSLNFSKLNSINIGYSGILPKIVLSDLRRNLARDFPELSVNFERLDKNEIAKSLEQDRLQFAIVDVDERDAISRIESVFLTHINFAVMAAKGHDLASIAPEQRLDTLKTMRQLVYKEHLDGPMTNKLLLSAKYEVINDLELMIQLIDDGLGWGILPKTVIYYLHRNYSNIQMFDITHLKDDFRIPFALWSKHDHRLSHLKTFISNSFMNSRNEIYQLNKQE